MKLAVSMWSLHRKYFHDGWTVIDFLKHCRAEGIENVELLDVFWRNQAEELEQVVDFCATNGITVAAYAVSNDLAQADSVSRAAEVEKIVRGFPIAKRLGTRIVRVFAGDIKQGMDFDTCFTYIVQGLREAAVIAADYGITMALENHGRLAGRSDQVRAIIDAVGSPYLRSTVDVGNFILVEQGSVEATRDLTMYAAHVHFKDLKRSPTSEGYKSLAGVPFLFTAIGDGEVDLVGVVGVLKERGYDGYASIEFEGDGDELEGLRKSVAFSRSKLS